MLAHSHAHLLADCPCSVRMESCDKDRVVLDTFNDTFNEQFLGPFQVQLPTFPSKPLGRGEVLNTPPFPLSRKPIFLAPAQPPPLPCLALGSRWGWEAGLCPPHWAHPHLCPSLKKHPCQVFRLGTHDTECTRDRRSRGSMWPPG